MRYPSNEPRDGERMTVKRFAWFPTNIGDTRVWLETYYESLIFRRWRLPSRLGEYGYWDLETGSPVVPYIGGGIGFANVSANNVKFTEEGVAAVPAFKAFQISSDCPFEVNNIKHAGANAIFLVMSEARSCEI